MDICSLILQPFNKQSFSVSLSKNDEQKGRVERIISKTSDIYIFSDLSYEFILPSESLSSIKNVDVYINDVYEPSVYNNGKITFPNKGIGERRIFIDCYGFVEIHLVVLDSEGIEHRYTTDFLPILVKHNELNDAVKAMVSYVYSNQEMLLLNGEPKAKNIANLKEHGYQNLSTQIILAEEIASIYETSYGYFKANSRFKIEKVSKVDRFERLQYVTPATVQFITTHPEELRKINSNSGIRVNGQVYQPEKTLSVQNEHSYDTYENQVVLGFIQKMIDSLDDLYWHCHSLLEQIPTNENYGDEYIYSAFFMFTETKKMLEDGLLHISCLRAQFTRLWEMYNGALKIKPEPMINAPHPSHIFISVPQYNRIFVQIHKWFTYGIYDFARERFMLSFIKISSLYEGYVLVKIISYFKSRGYELESAQKWVYPIKRNWKYRNTNCNNTFLFKNSKQKITLYYQPVIFDTDENDKNGIALIRNNSISITNEGSDYTRSGGHYYSPDYLIKVENDSVSKYLILDAKFSNLASVKRHHIKNLAFKYLFSISPIFPADAVVGLCIVYGKCSALERIQTAYDRQLPSQKVKPVTELLPLLENIANNEHYNNLDALMKRAFDL